MSNQPESQQWKEDQIHSTVSQTKEETSAQNPHLNGVKNSRKNKVESSSSQNGSSSSSQSSDQEELKVNPAKKAQNDQEDEWGDSNFEPEIPKQKKPVVRGNQSHQQQLPNLEPNIQSKNIAEKPQRGNTNFESNQQPQKVRVVNNFFGNKQEDQDEDNNYRNRGNGFQNRGRGGRGGFRGGRGGFGGGFGTRDNFDGGRGRGRGRGRGGFGNRDGGFNNRGGGNFSNIREGGFRQYNNQNSNQQPSQFDNSQHGIQGGFNQQQYGQTSTQFTPPPINQFQYSPTQQYVNPQDAFRKKSQGPIYVPSNTYQQNPVQMVPSLHGSRVVIVPQPTTVLNESLQISMIRGTDCQNLDDEPQLKAEKGKISAERKKWNLQKIKPEGRKAWPTISIKILGKTLQVTYRRISEHSACIVVIPITDLIFNIYPGTIIHQSEVNYKQILQSKWDRIQNPGSVYIKQSHLPKNFRFVGLAFIKISQAQESISNGLSRLFQSLREMARSQKVQSGLGNIVIPLSLFKDHQDKYQKFILKLIEMMEKKENDFVNQISLTTKDASEYEIASTVFNKIILRNIKNCEICVDQ